VPDTSFHEPLNKRLVPHMAEVIPAFMKGIRLGEISSACSAGPPGAQLGSD
jgi:hypothetical protein